MVLQSPGLPLAAEKPTSLQHPMPTLYVPEPYVGPKGPFKAPYYGFFMGVHKMVGSMGLS